MARKRNYGKENKWEDTPAQVKRRVQRNRARRKLEKEGRVHKGDGKQVDHKNLNPMDNRRGNLHVLSRHANAVKQPKHKRRRS